MTGSKNCSQIKEANNDISAIIVGRPVNLNGKPGKKAQSIRRLAEEINKTLKLC